MANDTQENVFVWLNNSPRLRSLMLESIAVTPNRDEAADYLLKALTKSAATAKGFAVIIDDRGRPRTPDGYLYSISAIKYAMVGIKRHEALEHLGY